MTETKRANMTDEEHDKLKTLMLEAMAESTTAKRRVEAAREEVARLERDLSAAQARLAVEQSEYDMAGKMMWQMFDYFKSEVQRRWKKADDSNPAKPKGPPDAGVEDIAEHSPRREGVVERSSTLTSDDHNDTSD